MAKLKVENQRRQKVFIAYRMELLPLFFLVVVDTSKVEFAYHHMAYARTLVVLCNYS